MGFSNKLIGYILLFILCIGVSYASFDVEANAVDSIIKLNESAVFDISIKNLDNEAQNFMIYSGEVEWDLTTDPSEDRYVKITDEGNIRILLKPTVDFWPNLYGVSVKVKNRDTNEVKSEEVLVQINGAPTEIDGEYLPAVLAKIFVSDNVDPRDGLNVDIMLTNQNRLDIDSLSIVLRSFLVNKEYETSLKGLETKELNFNIPLDSLTSPTEDILNADIYVESNGTRYSFKGNSNSYEIVPYGQVEESEKEDQEFLKYSNHVVLENTGNIKREYQYKIPRSIFKASFFSADPEPDVKSIGGAKYYVWQGDLDKTESLKINTQFNYRFLFYLFITILIIILLYFILRSPILVIKSAEVIRESEGGISDLAIKMHIKNRSARMLHTIEVRDRVPNLLEVKGEHELGSLKPANILRSENKGTIIKWNLDKLDPFEERILIYKVRSKLSIIGDFSLPKTVLKFKRNRAGDFKYINSNFLRMRYPR